MQQNNLLTDSVFVFLSFTDGDGDIGMANGSDSFDIQVSDNRTGGISDRFRLPEVPEQGANNGIRGEVQLKIYTTCCLFPDTGIPPCSKPEMFPTDTLTFDITIFDRAMNQSNTVTTESIILFCD